MNNALISINEVYFGKTKELLEIESLIGVIREKYGPKKGDNIINKYVYKGDRAKTNSSPEMLKINRLFEKAFGFESFFLMVIHLGTQNAMTMPVSGCLDAPEDTHKIQASCKGFKKNGRDKTFVCIFDGIFFNPDLTPAEVLGVILHEIGHNFQTAISPICRGFSYIDRIMKVIMIPLEVVGTIADNRRSVGQKAGNLAQMGMAIPLLSDNIRRKLVDNYVKTLRDNPDVSETIASNNLVMGAVAAPFAVVSSAIQIVMKLIRGLISPVLFFSVLAANIGNAALSVLDERGEIIADKFAAAYGYGAECQTALAKCRASGFGMPTEKLIRQIPVVQAYYDLIGIPNQILGNIIDCHPNQIYRSKDTLDYIKKELANEDLDPKMRAELMSQCKKLENNITRLTNPMADKGMFMFTNSWSALMLTLFNGDPKANLLGKGTAEEFDRAFQDNLTQIQRARAGR